MSDFWPWFHEHAAPRLNHRAETFQKMFEHLDSRPDPIRIIETGCMRYPDQKWQGDGCSTLMFDRYARSRGNGAKVDSVDISPESVAVARAAIGASSATQITCADSIQILSSLARYGVRDVGLLYLDAFDLDWTNPVPSGHHHLSELMAALPMLSDDSLVVVDDSPTVVDDFPHLEIGGKGAFVSRYAESIGAELRFLKWQAGWTHMKTRPTKDQETIEDVVRRARAAVEQDRLTVADALYRLILTLTMPPWTKAVQRVARGEACAFFARLAWSKGRHGTAADMYREAIVADPLCAEYHWAAATKCLLPLGALDTAIAEAQRGVRVEPEDSRARQALGSLYHERGDLKLAIAELEKAHALAPDDPGPVLDRAAAELDSGEYETALKLAKSVRGSTRDVDAIHVEGMALYRTARHEEAIERYREALAASCPDPGVIHFHMSLAMESIGQFPDAWRERSFGVDQKQLPALKVPYKRFDRPLFNWQGKGIVHVHAEAGSGDNIALARYLPQIAARGYSVRYECGDDLLPLMTHSLADVECVRVAADYPGSVGIPPFDYHLPVGALQNLFQVTPENNAWFGPYLVADPEKVAHFKTMLGEDRSVGLCWSSGIRLGCGPWLKEYGLRKSMHFEELAPVWGDIFGPRIQFVSLQVGPEREQNDPKETVVLNALPDKPNWDDTAALISCLDLVITVDTAVAHLAGALGKPVWTMCQKDAQSWHWMCWRPGSSWNDRNPWYPTARVFRQHEFNRPHYWDEVVDDVTVALRSFMR